VDFSSEALQASEKGLERLMEGYARLQKLTPSATSSVDTKGLKQKCEEAMSDDLNTPIVISHLFDALRAINLVHDGKETISLQDLVELQDVFKTFTEDLLGLKTETTAGGENEAYKKAIDLLLNMRLEAKKNKDWATSDKIRNELTALGFEIKDTRDGFEWKL
jgi:cysteinyl-tRNA synthetase